MNCPDISYNPHSGSISESDCKLCPNGFYNIKTPGTNEKECSACVEGFVKVLNVSGNYFCSPCSKGYFNEKKNSSCTICALGKFTSGNGYTSCLQCHAGSYAITTSQTVCQACPVGSYSTALGATSVSECKACPAGTFLNYKFTPEINFSIPEIMLAQACDSFYDSTLQNSRWIACSNYSRHDLPVPRDILFSRQIGATKEGGDYYFAVAHHVGINHNIHQVLVMFTHKSNIDNEIDAKTKLSIWEVKGACTYSNQTQDIIHKMYSANGSIANASYCNPELIFSFENFRGLIPNTLRKIESNMVLLFWEREDTFQNKDATEWTLNVSIRSKNPSLCWPCISGSYSENAGSFQCTECSQGKYSTGERASACISCAAGSYSSSIHRQCVLCEPGKFLLNQNSSATACHACFPGSFASEVGSTSCTLCIRGTYSSKHGNPVTCEQKCAYDSKKQGSSSADDCVECQPGTFKSISNEPFHIVDAPQSWIFDFGNSPGYNIRVLNYSRGTFSKRGAFNGEVLLSACIGIPNAYKISLNIHSFASSMVWSLDIWKCNQREVSIEDYFLYCQEVVVLDSESNDISVYHFFGEALFLIWHNYAEDGWVYFDTNPENPIKPNWDISFEVLYASPSQDHCMQCPVGTFSTGMQESKCKTCPIGTYSLTPKASSPFVCLECKKGTYNLYDIGECYACPLGKYGLTNMECALCNEGTYASALAQTACISCKAGTYNSEEAMSSCYKCELGSYSTTSGNTACALCQARTYTTAAASTHCFSCPFLDKVSNECIKCSTGQEIDNVTMKCKACAAGKINANPEHTFVCKECPDGYASNQNLTNCTPCAVGFHKVSGLCQRCPHGKISNSSVANHACIECEKGTYATPSSAGTACVKCSEGTFSLNFTCFECARGTYSSTQGATTCLQCSSKGYHTPSSSSCRKCAQGSYSNVTNATTCSLCSNGKYTTLLGASRIEDCIDYIFNETCQGCKTCPSPSRVKRGTECVKGSTVDTVVCECPRLSYFDGKSCIPCAQCLKGAETLRACGDGPEQRDITLCRCAPGFYGDGLTFCAKCPTCPSPSDGKEYITISTCGNTKRSRSDMIFECILKP